MVAQTMAQVSPAAPAAAPSPSSTSRPSSTPATTRTRGDTSWLQGGHGSHLPPVNNINGGEQSPVNTNEPRLSNLETLQSAPARNSEQSAPQIVSSQSLDHQVFSGDHSPLLITPVSHPSSLGPAVSMESHYQEQLRQAQEQIRQSQVIISQQQQAGAALERQLSEVQGRHNQQIEHMETTMTQFADSLRSLQSSQRKVH